MPQSKVEMRPAKTSVWPLPQAEGKQLEGLLAAASLTTAQDAGPGMVTETPEGLVPNPQLDLDLFGISNLTSGQDLTFGQVPLLNLESADLSQPSVGPPQLSAGVSPSAGNQLVGLGLFEQLPSFELIDTLTALYFRNVHAGAPMLHQATFTAALRLPPHMRPPMCLQYIVMASGAATDNIYRHLAEPFYQRARVYAEADELKGSGETFMSLAHAETWCLISGYECHVYAIFTRASTSLCRSVRLAQMLKLHQVDAKEPEAALSSLPPARSFIEAEERRRTWWVIFLADRYLTSSTGWPSLIDERLVRTNLPCSEAAYAAGVAEPGVPLSRGLRELEAGRGGQLAPLAFRILAANELLHTLDHSSSRRQLPDDDDDDAPSDVQSGAYWRRHREIDGNLATLAAPLPESLRRWGGGGGAHAGLDAILVRVSTDLAAMQLHRAALGVLQRRPPSSPENMAAAAAASAHSRGRLLPAARGVLGVFRESGASLAAAIRNPVLAFAAYVAAAVFMDDFRAAASASSGGGGGAAPGPSYAPPGACRTALAEEEADDPDAWSRRRASEEGLNFLARALVHFGTGSPLVRTMAFQLAVDMKQAGYDSSMMEKVLNQVVTLGGSTFEILLPSSKGLPLVFCPALAATPGPSSDETAAGSTSGRSGGLGFGGGGSGIPLQDSYLWR